MYNTYKFIDKPMNTLQINCNVCNREHGVSWWNYYHDDNSVINTVNNNMNENLFPLAWIQVIDIPFNKNDMILDDIDISDSMLLTEVKLFCLCNYKCYRIFFYNDYNDDDRICKKQKIV
jgi:hypothetical protein